MVPKERWLTETYERDGKGSLIFNRSVHLTYTAAMLKRSEWNRKGRDIVIVRRLPQYIEM